MVRVDGPGGPNRIQPRKTREVKKAAKPGEFAAHLRRLDQNPKEETEAKDQVSALAGVGGILAAQAIDPDTGQAPSYEERKRRARQGHDILERLEEIRRGLLQGRIPKDRLATVARLVRKKRESGADPLICQLLDEIELRAKVELAKLARR